MKVQAIPFEVVQHDTTIDGVFIKHFALPQGVVVPQHAHAHSHATIIAKGKVRVWKGQLYDDIEGGNVLLIEAHVKHEFLALEDSELYCVHNAEHALIASENKLEFV